MRRLLFAIVIGIGGAAILISLGVWQVQRLAWKEALLAKIDAKIDADPISLQAAVDPEFQRYAPVRMTGAFGEGHVRMLASRRNIGPVYRVIRPFFADSYGMILVDTGWLAEGDILADPPADTLTLTGNLDKPNEADRFTPVPDTDANIWFARDVEALARHLSTEAVLVVLRDQPAQDLGVTPWPVDTRGIPNDHLQYAITWFSLAVIWLGMSAYFLRRRRGPQKG